MEVRPQTPRRASHMRGIRWAGCGRCCGIHRVCTGEACCMTISVACAMSRVSATAHRRCSRGNVWQPAYTVRPAWACGSRELLWRSGGKRSRALCLPGRSCAARTSGCAKAVTWGAVSGFVRSGAGPAAAALRRLCLSTSTSHLECALQQLVLGSVHWCRSACSRGKSYVSF